MTPGFQDICKVLRELKGYHFEVLCNDYLKARHPNLTPVGISTRGQWPIPGTLDAFGLDESGRLIACQYSAQESGWRGKLTGDAKKVANFAAANQLTVGQLIFCTTVEDDPAESVHAKRRIENEYGFPVEICGLQRLAYDLEALYPGIAARRLGIPISLQHFMALDAYLDNPNPRLWPKRQDVEEGKLYGPESYIKEVREKLLREKRLLLVGKSGAGKSGVAIAFGLQWRRQGKMWNSRDGHPEAVGFYLEATVGCPEETGEDWYRQVLSHDYQNELFLIDNCHLAPAAVNTFCYQWERRRPERALVLLISAPKVSESPWEDEPDDYFEGFEQARAVVEVQPEQIYSGVLRAYSEAYHRTDPTRFVPVEVDWEDSERAAQLERYCAHNLSAARSMLEVWGDVGGQLSDVTEESILNGLASRHLTQNKASALGPLCNLAQFEIPAHDHFVCQLPQEIVAVLRRENLMVVENSPVYGRCHRIGFHPHVAALIFRAYIRRQVGSSYESRIDDETFHHLRQYLSAYPENFTEAYYRLYRVGAVELQHRLLRDADSQGYAARQFTTRPVSEVVWYLYAMYRIDPDRAMSLLQDFVSQMSIETLQTRILALKGAQFSITSSFLPKMSLSLARAALGNLPPREVADRITLANLTLIGKWIRPASSSLAAQLGYTEGWRQEVAKALDVDALVATARDTNPQSVAWFLQDLVAITPGQAKHFVDNFSAEALGQKLSGQPLSVIHNIFESLKALGCASGFQKRVAQVIDPNELLTRAQQTSLLNLYWLLRDLKAIAPELAEHLLTQITPEGLANLFREGGSTASDFHHLLEVCGGNFARSFFSQFPLDEIVAMLESWPLGEIGGFVEWRYHLFRYAYAVFAARHLPGRLLVEGIDEIGKFIARLQRVPEEGKQLTMATLNLLSTVDLAVRVAETDVEHFAVFLLNAHSVDPSYSQRLLTSLAPSRAVENALQRSGIRGIQLLLRNLSEMAPTFLQSIGESLQSVDFTDRIAEAQIRDLGHFLWNVRANMGPELAQSYCRIVDTHLRPEQIANADLIELGKFLWNLVHISDLQDLATLRQPGLQDRLRNEWGNHPGPCAWVLGIIAQVHPYAAKDLNLPTLDVEGISGMLTDWLRETLNGKHPYSFALAAKGLQVLDERQAIKIVRNVLPDRSAVEECLELLREAMRQAVTPRSKAVLEDATGLIQQIGNA